MKSVGDGKSSYGTLPLVTATVIGSMAGTGEGFGRGGTQAIANPAGDCAGRELVRLARSDIMGCSFSFSTQLTTGEPCCLHLSREFPNIAS